MKRQPHSAHTPRYPTLAAAFAASLAITPLISGCDLFARTTGDLAPTETCLDLVEMDLPAGDPRILIFADPYAMISYRMELTVRNSARADATAAIAEALLDAADGVLLGHDGTTFRPENTDLTAIEAELLAALEATEGMEAGDLSALHLVIVSFTEEQQIDGDIAEPE